MRGPYSRRRPDAEPYQNPAHESIWKEEAKDELGDTGTGLFLSRSGPTFAQD